MCDNIIFAFNVMCLKSEVLNWHAWIKLVLSVTLASNEIAKMKFKFIKFVRCATYKQSLS